eukprot:1150026-Pelagomonas_calceolata.AAC.2
MNLWQAGIICRSNWTLSAGPSTGPGLSYCTSVRMLNEAFVPSGAVLWAWASLPTAFIGIQ